MPDRLSRRDFLRLGVLAAASTVVSGCTANLQRTEYLESYVRPPEDGLPGENLWYATTCRQCAAGCGVIVRVSNGRARKIEGNPLHPVNRGKLCARGQAALQELYDPDRLQGAVRQAGRGTRQFTPIRWEDALATLTQRLQSVPSESVAFLVGNMSTHLEDVLCRFRAALGANPTALARYSLGDELEGSAALTEASARLLNVRATPWFRLATADIVFSFGANFLETWISPVHYSQAYSQMRQGPLGRRGYLVQFEPRMSATAACADEWLLLHPGSDGLVAAGLARILVERGERRDNDALNWPVEQVDMDQVVRESGIPLAELERLAGLLGTGADPLVIPGATMAAHANGPEALEAVLALNALLGEFGQSFEGGVQLGQTQPGGEACQGDVQGLIEKMAAGQVQVLLIHGTNPLFELPPAAGFAAALERVPLVVSFSSTVDETAVQSDLVLPDHTNLESWGYHRPRLVGLPVWSALQPIMSPLHDTRSTVDVVLALAQALGGDVAKALPWANEVEYLQEALAPLRGAEAADPFWAAFRRQGGWWERPGGLPIPHPGVVPTYTVPLVPPPSFPQRPADYPLHLHLFPSLTLPDGRGANRSWLQETPDPMTTVAWQTWVELNPETARELGVQDDDVVRVISPDGAIETIVYTRPGLHRELVAIPVGRGHEAGGRYATWGYGGNPVRLLAAPGAGGRLAWATTQVRIERTGRRHSLARLESVAGVEYLRQEE